MLLGTTDKPRGKKAAKVEEECKKAGGTWYHWDQGTFLGKGQTFGKGGVCAPIVVVWLRHVAARTGNWGEFMKTPDAREEVMTLKTLQHKNPTNYVETHLKDFKFKKAFTQAGDTDEAIAKLITVPGYYMVGISNLQGEFADDKQMSDWAKDNLQGHALGTVCDKDVFAFFDPNFGSGVFPSAEKMGAFFKKFWKNVYADMRGSPMITRFFKT